MFRPWFPLKLNFTGMALPALTLFKTGRLSIGWKKPFQLKLTVIRKLPFAVLLWESVAKQLTVVCPMGKLEPDAGTQVTKTEPSTRSVAEAL